MMFIIDRITEQNAYLEPEFGELLILPRSSLPEGAREGDVLRRTDGGYILDPDETLIRRERAQRRLQDLLSR